MRGGWDSVVGMIEGVFVCVDGMCIGNGEVVELRFFFSFHMGFFLSRGVLSLLFRGVFLYSFGKTLHGYWGPFRKQDEEKGRGVLSVRFLSFHLWRVVLRGWMDGRERCSKNGWNRASVSSSHTALLSS